MIKYLDMENATLEVEIKDVNKLIDFLIMNTGAVEFLNIKRIIVYLSCKDIQTFIEQAPELKNIIYLIKSKLNSKFSLNDWKQNILIVNLNTKHLVVSDYIYNQFEVKDSNYDLIIESFNKTENIILDCKPKTNEITEFNKLLNNIFDKLKDKLISLDGFMIPIDLIREHPCNFYLCDGWKCKKQISQLPKLIKMDHDFNLFPHGIHNSRFLIGNAGEDTIDVVLDRYLKSREFENFKKLCSKTFIKYIPNYPFNYFPVTVFLKKEAIYGK